MYQEECQSLCIFIVAIYRLLMHFQHLITSLGHYYFQSYVHPSARGSTNGQPLTNSYDFYHYPREVQVY